MFTKFVRNAFLPAAAAFFCMSASAATPVTQCGQKLNVAGETYEFTGNLSCFAPGQIPTIFIQADGVKVDMKGFTFTGNGVATAFISSSGPACVALKNVEISNGVITSAGRAVGICAPGATSVETRWHVHDLQIRGVGSGIGMFNANKNHIHNVNMERLTLVNPNGPPSRQFGYGIELDNSDGNSIHHNTVVRANETGIHVGTNSSDNDVKFNQVTQTKVGIRVVTGASENLVRGNKSVFNTVDMQDDTFTPACGTTDWIRNNFTVANQFCIH